MSTLKIAVIQVLLQFKGMLVGPLSLALPTGATVGGIVMYVL